MGRQAYTPRPQSEDYDEDRVPLGTTLPPEPRDIGLADIGKGAWNNLGPSAKQAALDTVHPMLHPLETMDTVFRRIPTGLAEKAGLLSPGENSEVIDAIVQQFKDDFGGSRQIKHRIANHPVGFLLDASLPVSFGVGALLRIPRVARGAEVVKTWAKTTASDAVGDLSTVGGQTIRDIAAGGQEGGAAAKAAQESMRGQVPVADVRTAVHRGIDNVAKQEPSITDRFMAIVMSDKRPLDFTKIKERLATAYGIDDSAEFVQKTKAIRDATEDAIRTAETSDPTAAGMLKLRQKLKEIWERTPADSAERMAAADIYEHVSHAILKTVPKEHVRVMTGIEEANRLLKEMQTTLQDRPGAEIGVSLRKLQATLAHTVDPGLGHPKMLAQYLAEAGSPHLLRQLAGQVINSTSRGYAKVLGEELVKAGKIPDLSSESAIAAMAPFGVKAAFLSPRAAGEAAYYAGKASNYVPMWKAAIPPYQLGHIQRNLDDNAR